MALDMRSVNPQNIGWIESRLDEAEMSHLWKVIANKNTKINKELAGIIDSSYELVDIDFVFFNNILLPVIAKYESEFGPIVRERIPISTEYKYYMDRWWVNYQKQGEFNPIHYHVGLYSFVIWMKIPTSWEDQNRRFSKDANNKVVSSFQFHYSDILGCSMDYNYNLEKDYEGIMLLFPSSLRHSVNPFYGCDGDRISISGNVSFDLERKMRPPEYPFQYT